MANANPTSGRRGREQGWAVRAPIGGAHLLFRRVRPRWAGIERRQRLICTLPGTRHRSGPGPARQLPKRGVRAEYPLNASGLQLPIFPAPPEPRREPLLMRAQACDQLPVMLSARQYLLLIVAICAVTGLLLLPSITAFGPTETLVQVLALFASTSLAVGLQMGVSYLLRYANNPVRRWLDQQVLWLNVLIRAALSLAVAAIYTCLHFKTDGFGGLGAVSKELRELRNAIAGSQIFAVIVLFIQLAVETLERSQYLAGENKRLLQEQLQASYAGLKQQLSPHFLFNSLSTLGGLIDEDPAAARRFVGGMSSVYRYLLRHGEQSVVPLHEEVAFLRSYCYLLQTRFGDGLQVKIDLPTAVQHRLVPPLALQLLVENAVKHNVLTQRQPLRLTIEFQAPATLLVRNTLCPRPTPEPSSGLGLSNLSNRIRLIHHRELLVEKTTDTFCVHLPLPAET